jgi:vacuolar-type H+-ATPase subunit I/STV1
LETIEDNVSSTSQGVEDKAKTVNQHYEEVLKKTEQINNYEDRLTDNLSEIEDRSEQLNKQQEDVNEIEGRIDTLLNGAVAASLDRNFTERKDELEWAAKIWAGFSFIAIIALIVGAYLIFENITQFGGLGAGTISRVTLLIPLLVGVWFTSKNYSRKRRLMEEYAFKSTMAQTLEPSRKVLESQESFDETDAQLAEFMLVSMGQMFTNPSGIVENGGTTTEDDATNIETVMDLARRIAKGK